MENLDLRVQKTYMALINSFNLLLKNKDFEDISVTEICDGAMVRRQTFYKHFIDKYDFLTYFVKRRINHIFMEAFKNAEVTESNFYAMIFKQLIKELDESILLIFKLQMQADTILELESIKEFGKNMLSTMESNDSINKGEKYLEYKRYMIMSLTINSVNWYKQNKHNISYEEIMSFYNDLLNAIQ
ncbi:MAG: TetR/AcrR family transcriptional regulator [Erysipelothrix sp.]|nr:TetR/AcrR family transcriptional regulator [Erysipelothrix sp.]